MKEERIYKKHAPEDDRLYPSQKQRLRMAKQADRVCRRHHIPYTLAYSTLSGAVARQGFYKENYGFYLGMFYADLQRFKEVFPQEPEGRGYALLDHTNFEDFNQMDLIIMEKSAVKLPRGREKDEWYYGCGIVITPIFYAGDTKQEYEAFRQKADRLLDIINARDVLLKKISPWKRLRHFCYWQKQRRDYDARTGGEFSLLKQHLLEHQSVRTEYAYLPVSAKQKGCVRRTETYERLEEVSFEGTAFFAVREREAWVAAYYGRKGKKTLENLSFNLFYAYGLHLLREVQLIQADLLAEIDRICNKHDIPYYISYGTVIGAVRHKGFIPWDDDADIVMMWEDYRRFQDAVKQDLNREKYFFSTPDTDPHSNMSFGMLRRNGTATHLLSRRQVDTHLGIPVDILVLFPGSDCRLAEMIRDRLCRFFKTMLWAHCGARESRLPLRKYYYRLLARVSNQKAYALFLKTATWSRRKTDSLLFPYVIGTFQQHQQGMTDKNNYGEPVFLEFEGMQLPAPKEYHAILSDTYGAGYQEMPPYPFRTAPHTKREFLDLRGVEPHVDGNRR